MKIKQLEDMSLGHRIALTFIIVMIVLLCAAAAGYVSGRWEAIGAEPQLYQGVPLDAHLLQLDRAALEAAYSAHLAKLWSVWLTDGAREAHRITNGLKIARGAYAQAAEQIEKREREAKGATGR